MNNKNYFNRYENDIIVCELLDLLCRYAIHTAPLTTNIKLGDVNWKDLRARAIKAIEKETGETLSSFEQLCDLHEKIYHSLHEHT